MATIIKEKEVFDILGIEEENRSNTRHLIQQFRELAKKYDAGSIWLKGDEDYAGGTVIDETDDLIAVSYPDAYVSSDIPTGEGRCPSCGGEMLKIKGEDRPACPHCFEKRRNELFGKMPDATKDYLLDALLVQAAE